MAFEIDDVLMLRDGEVVFVACFFDLHPRASTGVRGAHEIRVETRAGAHFSRAPPAVSEMQCDGIVGMAGDDHDSGFQCRGRAS